MDHPRGVLPRRKIQLPRSMARPQIEGVEEYRSGRRRYFMGTDQEAVTQIAVTVKLALLPRIRSAVTDQLS